MASQSTIYISDVTQTSEWKCYQKSDGSWAVRSTSITDDSATRTVTISGIPAGATNIVARQYYTTTSPNGGIKYLRIDGTGVDTLESSYVYLSINGNGSYDILFEYMSSGRVYSNTTTHSGAVSFTNMSLVVSYTEPTTSFTINSGTSVTAGDTVSITLSTSTAYSNRVTISFGSYSDTTTLNAGVTNYSFTIPTSWLGAIPNASSGVATILVETLSGSTVISSSQKSFTISCPTTGAAPTPGTQSLTVQNTQWNVILQRYSSLSATQTGYAGVSGSTITSISFTCDGAAISYQNWNSCSTSVFTSSGYVTVTATVVDSRGGRASTSARVYVTPYQPPEINSVYAERCNGSNVSSSTGTGGHILIGCGYTAIGSNTITAKVEYKAKSSSVWLGGVYVTPSTTAYALFANEGTFESSTSYDIRVTITDSLNQTAVLIQTLGTAYAFMQWEPQTNAIGFGCYPQGANRVEISESWDLYVKGQSISDLIENSSSSKIIVSATRPTNPESGTIWLDIS